MKHLRQNSSNVDELSAKERAIYSRLAPGQLPQHIAIIMDGNGRWAISGTFLGSLAIAALVGGLAVAAQPVSANDGAAAKHVLLISVDGLHQTDLA